MSQASLNKLRSSLEAHKCSLNVALDMMTISVARDIKASTIEIGNAPSAIKEQPSKMPNILDEIARLQSRLRQSDSGFILQIYLDNFTTYTGSTYDRASVADFQDEFENSDSQYE
ncbi:hypothetical protein K432DRAFT_405524 [Lepidopterella palustris CBS 459.81]|uniref:Uncharacterized protein n=1 Tax=Lepidopterella palustris CBS 459.81 TaxID=1314670 RepID=A0A8E2JEH9_9PEZI|nr:hypothetical protein K432DRAFT_405524 [Lepidopterella palustris CBS 459.81]